MPSNRVLCYGGIAIESFVDLPYRPKPGIAHIICDENYRLGGGAAHVAEWLGSWGVPTRLSGYLIGTDRHGDRLWNWLSEYPSIDLGYLQRQPEVDTLRSLTIPFSDGNKYLLCIGYANPAITPPSAEMLEDVGILEVAFYYRQVPGNAAAAEMARLAAAKGIRIVAMDLLDPEDPLIAAADTIINSAASIIEQYPGADIVNHSRRLQAAGGAIVITTDGSRAIHALDRDGTHYTLLPPRVAPIETTGAGDSFRAGIIFGLLQGWPLPESLRWAAAVSAWQVRRSLSQDHPPSQQRISSLAQQIDVSKVG